MESLPEIRIQASADSVASNLIGQQSPEPEVEECCEDNQMKEILESLGLEFDKLSRLRSINHTLPSSTCTHCKLIQKVKALQDGIEKLSGELETTEEILKARQMQNKDIKSIIQRLEGSIGTTEVSVCEEEPEESKSCSCNNNCSVF